MRALASPASLKGVLSAVDAAAALAEGCGASAAGGDELPVADGGEGTAEVLAAALGGEWRTAVVSDPLGRPVSARVALASGPDRGGRVGGRRSGWRCSARTSATRCVLRAAGSASCSLAALAAGPAALLVCLGGTATVDGGAGSCEVLGGWLRVPVRVACDVRNPLLGPRGAARVFGPQKGAGARGGGGARARGWPRCGACAVSRPAGRGGGGRARCGARCARRASSSRGAELVLDLIGFDERAPRRRLRRHRRGNGRRDDARGEGARRGRCASVARRACRARSSAAASGAAPGAELRALSGDPRVRARIWSRLATAAGGLGCRAPRVAVWRAPGAASTRCARSPSTSGRNSQAVRP